MVEHAPPLPWWRHLWHCYRDPFNLLLTALAAVSWATHDLKATVVIGVMVVLSTAFRFVQEQRSTHAAERRKGMVKRLDATQNLGAMGVLCTDMTGPLTPDQIALERHVDAFGRPSAAVLALAWLTSHHQTGLKNLLDRAVLAHAGPGGQDGLRRRWRKVDEIPFDFQRRRLSVLVASAFLPFLPMLPLQLLVQNLAYDISQTAIPFDRVDEELVREPLRWQPGDIGRFMVCFGPVSSVFDLAAFAVLWWMFGFDTPAEQGLFQSGWFVVGLLTQTLVVHMLRTPKLPFVHSRPAALLAAATLGIAALGLWLPMGPLAADFKLQPLPPAFFAWLAGLLLGYSLLVSGVKRWYVRRFGWQ